MRQTSRPESLRSLPNLQIEVGNVDLPVEAIASLGITGCFEEKLECLAEVVRGVFHGIPLARNIKVGTEGDIPVILSFNDRR